MHNQLSLKQLFAGVVSFLFLHSYATPIKNTDPFIPYLDHIPDIIKVLTSDTIQNKEESQAIVLQSVIFSSRGGRNQVYALLARPLISTPEHRRLPALLCLHGGGSKAEDLRSMVKQYAAHGYLALAPDLPGICNPSKTPYSSGPWKQQPKGEAPRFDIIDSVGSSTLVDAEIAGLEAFNLLKAQPQVDTAKIGITGFSWGGYSTTLLSGLLGNRVKAAYAVFGCGFYDKGSFWTALIRQMPVEQRQRWLSRLDAGRRAGNMKAPFFIESATNDTYFWPEAVSATLRQIKGVRNHVWNPNLNHRQGPDGPLMQRIYFDYYLKEEGSPFGKVQINAVSQLESGEKKITASVQLPTLVAADSVYLYYCLKNQDWQHRNWHALAMTKMQNSGQYIVSIPADIGKQKINFFVWMKDQRKVVVSSKMY